MKKLILIVSICIMLTGCGLFWDDFIFAESSEDIENLDIPAKRRIEFSNQGSDNIHIFPDYHDKGSDNRVVPGAVNLFRVTIPPGETEKTFTIVAERGRPSPFAQGIKLSTTCLVKRSNNGMMKAVYREGSFTCT